MIHSFDLLIPPQFIPLIYWFLLNSFLWFTDSSSIHSFDLRIPPQFIPLIYWFLLNSFLWFTDSSSIHSFDLLIPPQFIPLIYWFLLNSFLWFTDSDSIHSFHSLIIHLWYIITFLLFSNLFFEWLIDWVGETPIRKRKLTLTPGGFGTPSTNPNR